MNKLLLMLSVPALMFSCNKKDGYQIHGTGEQLKDGQQIILKRYIGNREFEGIDTVEVLNGKFDISGKLEHPELLFLNTSEKQQYKLMLENSSIEIKVKSDDAENLEIKGSKVHADYETYLELVKPFNEKQKVIYKEHAEASENQDKEAIAKANEAYHANSEEKNASIKAFVIANNKSTATPQIIYEALFYTLKFEELDEVFSRLDASLRSFPVSQKIEKHILTLRKVAIGQKAPDFSQYTPNGDRISLSSIKGKAVLVDFWASWCGPCRRANPHVVEMYKKYHEQGLEILGVSLDKDKEAWKKAIENDQLTWTQISDLKGWSNEAAKLYGVTSIPHVILLDSDGKIVAKQLHGEELENKIKELLSL